MQGEGTYGLVEQMKLTARHSQEQYLPGYFSFLDFPKPFVSWHLICSACKIVIKHLSMTKTGWTDWVERMKKHNSLPNGRHTKWLGQQQEMHTSDWSRDMCNRKCKVYKHAIMAKPTRICTIQFPPFFVWWYFPSHLVHNKFRWQWIAECRNQGISPISAAIYQLWISTYKLRPISINCTSTISQTVVCIPIVDGVLEIGTTEKVNSHFIIS